MAYRIYLTDDDRFLTNLYATKFRNAGHDTTLFNSANELLARLRKDKDEGAVAPDVILLDLVMPEIDGFAALEAIHKEGLAKGVKILILSNEGEEAEIERANQLGVDGYLVKASAVPSEVLEEISRVVQGRAGKFYVHAL